MDSTLYKYNVHKQDFKTIQQDTTDMIKHYSHPYDQQVMIQERHLEQTVFQVLWAYQR
jgi:hypothetical protein